jgi:hypothetical protein
MVFLGALQMLGWRTADGHQPRRAFTGTLCAICLLYWTTMAKVDIIMDK